MAKVSLDWPKATGKSRVLGDVMKSKTIKMVMLTLVGAVLFASSAIADAR